MKKHFSIKINNEERVLIIIKKNKKNLSLHVKPNLEIILSIPMKIPYSYGLKIVEDKRSWIEEKIKKYTDLEGVEGFYYLGNIYSKDSINTMITEDRNSANSLDEWYLYKLKIILEDKIEKYSNIMKLYPKKIRIKYLKSAWGICYSNGNITFNLNLIKVPLNVIDYLVIHELGHLKHPNHSKDYWDYIETFIKNPKQYRKWLKENGYKFL